MIRYSRFIALGDSFTEGVGDIQIDGQFMGWADRVAERLAKEQPDFSFYNLAIRGKLVSQVIEDQIPEAIKWIEGPTTLLSFHAGANDVLRPGYDPEVVLPQYREAVRNLAATGAQLLLFTAIERVAKSGKMQELWHQRFSGFNNNVRAIALEVGAIVADANLDPDIASRRFLDADRLHLNPAGHARVAESVLELIGADFDPNWNAPLPPLPELGKIQSVQIEVKWIITFLIPWISRRIRESHRGMADLQSTAPQLDFRNSSERLTMKIDSVDLFYLRMPEVLDIGDGSQDALLVRVTADGYVGWGEAEASPLTSIASWIAPMSHSACHPVIDSVLGEQLNSPEDIFAITRKVRANSFYAIIQSDLTLSGIEIALWDLLGQVKEEPIYKLLGYKEATRKLPYASVLFGDTAEETLKKASDIRKVGFSAIKFGWGPFGRGSVQDDADHIHAAREGIGADAHLMIDAGTIFHEDVEAAAARLQALSDANVLWYEEPFDAAALASYGALSKRTPKVKLAGGEGAHNPYQAEHLIDHGGVGFVQIDTGYIGGIGDAYRVAQYAKTRGVQFVNHTFTSHSALSASLQPFAGLKDSWITEYPMEPKSLCVELTVDKIEVESDGMITIPDRPGIGLEINLAAVKKYLVETEIKVGGKVLYTTPTV